MVSEIEELTAQLDRVKNKIWFGLQQAKQKKRPDLALLLLGLADDIGMKFEECKKCHGEGMCEYYYDDSEIVRGEGECGKCEGTGLIEI